MYRKSNFTFHFGLVLFLFKAIVDAADDIILCTDRSTQFAIINTVPMTQNNATSVVFSVKSCENVRLIFTGNETSLRPSYIVVIGINQKTTQVSRLTTCMTSGFSNCIYDPKDTPDILDCDSFRSFWVQWGDKMSFGKGDIINNDVIKSQQWNSKIKMDFIGIQTDSGNRDMWILKSGQGLQYQSPVPCEEQTTTSIITTTSSTETVTSVSSDVQTLCDCQCSYSNKWAYLQNLNLTINELRYELRDHLKNLTNAVKVDTKSTTRYLSRKKSAPDARSSSASIGLVGALIIALVPVCFVSIDILNLIIFLSGQK